jgi:hypothetical protein
MPFIGATDEPPARCAHSPLKRRITSASSQCCARSALQRSADGRQGAHHTTVAAFFRVRARARARVDVFRDVWLSQTDGDGCERKGETYEEADGRLAHRRVPPKASTTPTGSIPARGARTASLTRGKGAHRKWSAVVGCACGCIGDGLVGGGQHGWSVSGPTSSLDETVTPTVVKIRRRTQSSPRRVLLMTREGAKAETKSPKLRPQGVQRVRQRCK